MGLALDLEAIAEQERALQYARFDAEAAWRLGALLRGLGVERRYPVAIEVRRFGQCVFYTALDGAVPDNAEWVRRKSNVVARFLRSSYAVGLSLQMAGTDLMGKYGLGPADFASHGGAFPLSVTNVGVIGTVTVSGLPQRADHELVVEALCAELGRDYAALALSTAA